MIKDKKMTRQPDNTLPVATSISRRDFLLWFGASIAAAGVGTGVAAAQEHTRTDTFVINTPHPGHNPAFNYGETKGGELLLWFLKGDETFNGYRMNPKGYQLWKLFDGKTSVEDISRLAASRLNLTTRDINSFISYCETRQILVYRGELVLGQNMPVPPKGSCFYAAVQKLS